MPSQNAVLNDMLFRSTGPVRMLRLLRCASDPRAQQRKRRPVWSRAISGIWGGEGDENEWSSEILDGVGGGRGGGWVGWVVGGDNEPG